jgi:hypothetical protein
LEGNLEQAAARLGRAVPTGIDEDFLYQLARHRGTELTAEQVKELQQKMLGRS